MKLCSSLIVYARNHDVYVKAIDMVINACAYLRNRMIINDTIDCHVVGLL